MIRASKRWRPSRCAKQPARSTMSSRTTAREPTSNVPR